MAADMPAPTEPTKHSTSVHLRCAYGEFDPLHNQFPDMIEKFRQKLQLFAKLCGADLVLTVTAPDVSEHLLRDEQQPHIRFAFSEKRMSTTGAAYQVPLVHHNQVHTPAMRHVSLKNDHRTIASVDYSFGARMEEKHENFITRKTEEELKGYEDGLSIALHRFADYVYLVLTEEISGQITIPVE